MDAGWRDDNNDGVLEKEGQDCVIVLQVMPGRTSQQFAELLQSEFKRIGVHLEISVIDSVSAIQRIVQGNYDAAYLAWSLDADPDLYSKFTHRRCHRTAETLSATLILKPTDSSRRHALNSIGRNESNSSGSSISSSPTINRTRGSCKSQQSGR